jgi:hypothetical protein
MTDMLSYEMESVSPPTNKKLTWADDAAAAQQKFHALQVRQGPVGNG